jgi:hypothetical protein
MLFNLVSVAIECSSLVDLGLGCSCALGFECCGRYLWHRGRGGRRLALEMYACMPYAVRYMLYVCCDN